MKKLLLSNARYFTGILGLIIMASGAAAPLPSINNSKTVVIPVIKADDGRYWEAQLQCDNGVTNCIVVYTREICTPGVTRFSPSFCWEFGR